MSGCRTGGGYHIFAGREAARALGKMSLDPKDCTAELDDLSEKELGVLADWEAKFNQKYNIVGQVWYISTACVLGTPGMV